MFFLIFLPLSTSYAVLSLFLLYFMFFSCLHLRLMFPPLLPTSFQRCGFASSSIASGTKNKARLIQRWKCKQERNTTAIFYTTVTPCLSSFILTRQKLKVCEYEENKKCIRYEYTEGNEPIACKNSKLSTEQNVSVYIVFIFSCRVESKKKGPNRCIPTFHFSSPSSHWIQD